MGRVSSQRVRAGFGFFGRGRYAEPAGEGVRMAAFTECRHPLLWRSARGVMLNPHAPPRIYLIVARLLSRARRDRVPVGGRGRRGALLGPAAPECREDAGARRAD